MRNSYIAFTIFIVYMVIFYPMMGLIELNYTQYTMGAIIFFILFARLRNKDKFNKRK